MDVLHRVEERFNIFKVGNFYWRRWHPYTHTRFLLSLYLEPYMYAIEPLNIVEIR